MVKRRKEVGALIKERIYKRMMIFLSGTLKFEMNNPYEEVI